jgi:glycosyltransferase involved in cell wall biosynthesis
MFAPSADEHVENGSVMPLLTNVRRRRVVPPQRDTRRRTEILILCQLFHPELVSTGQTLTELAEQLEASGVDVEVVCGPPTVLGRGERVPRRMEHKGIRIRRVWGTRFSKRSLLGRVTNELTFTSSVLVYLLLHRPRRPILVLTNPPFLAVICGVLRALRAGPPYLHLIFDVYPDTAVRLGLLKETGLVTRIWDRLNLFVYERAAGVVVIGRCMKDVVSEKIRRVGHAVNGKLHHIHVWCDDQAIASRASSANGLAERFDVEGRFVVGYFGNMGRFHDIETILGAAELLKAHPDVVFLFVGEGHKKKWAMDCAQRNGLANCRFHTYVKREELGNLLALADVGLVSLSDGQEGLSVPSKTYGLMASGVPVLAVVPEASEIARVVQEEHCGIWIRPGDKEKLASSILQASFRRHELEPMAENGRRAIRGKYSLENACRQYVDLIKSISS